MQFTRRGILKLGMAGVPLTSFLGGVPAGAQPPEGATLPSATGIENVTWRAGEVELFEQALADVALHPRRAIVGAGRAVEGFADALFKGGRQHGSRRHKNGRCARQNRPGR